MYNTNTAHIELKRQIYHRSGLPNSFVNIDCLDHNLCNTIFDELGINTGFFLDWVQHLLQQELEHTL